MRTGVMVAGAIAVAATSTAALMGAGIIGAQPQKTTVAAAAPPVTQAPVRQVRSVPIAAQVPIAPWTAGTLAEAPPQTSPPPAPAPVAESRPTPSPAPVETTGSIAPQKTRPVYVSGSRVALRDAPSSTGKLIERLGAGQKLVELSRDGQWVRVRYPSNGGEGWISSEFVSDKPRN